MATTPYTKVSSASLAGLITDGNALMITEQSNKAEANYEILRDGTRRRRRPIIQEPTTGTNIPYIADTAQSSYLWQTPAFRDNYSLMVEEIQGEIRFSVLDHDNPQYVRTVQLEDRVWLPNWGLRIEGFNYVEDDPCTYTEGNGSLYIFNRVAGCIKVELLEDDTLRMSPLLPWVRDYRGAAENQAMDLRPEVVGSTAQYAVGAPYYDPAEEVLITNNLQAERAYNLSNTGWDAKGISDFMTQSQADPDSATLWPATTDRYLAGRKIAEDGSDTFSWIQLRDAKDHKNLPIRGARIGPSDVGAAGTLVGCPHDVLDNTTQFTATGDEWLRVTFDNRVSHTSGLSTAEVAIFIHALTFTITETNGRVYQGGFSGMVNAFIDVNDPNVLQFRIPQADNEPTFTLTSLYVHPSPEYFPHRLGGNDNAFDYRQTGKRSGAGEFFAGRLWYTADNHNRVYYSQILETSTEKSEARGVQNENLCFAVADPTNGDDNAVVPSDGGYINTADSGTHHGLVTLGDSLILLTDRGIWAIRPGSTGVFNAANFRLEKVAEVNVLGTQCYTIAGSELYVACAEGIMKVTLESTSFGNTSVVYTRVLDNKLMKGYEEILEKWPRVQVSYSPDSRTLRWLFGPERGQEQNLPNERQPLLSYSFYHDAWYKYEMGQESLVIGIDALPYSAGVESYNKFRYLIATPVVLTSYDTEWGAEVDFNEYGVREWIGYTAEENNRFSDYRGLGDRDPVPAYMLTNHSLPGQGINWHQINYIVVHNRNVTKTENLEGGTLLSIRWDWMDRDETHKWADPYQTYRFRRRYFAPADADDKTRGEPVLVHKMKLRGRGREFRLYFESDGHKDSHIEGWAYQGYILNGV